MKQSPSEHYDLAEEFLHLAKTALSSENKKVARDAPALLIMAQVHATLATCSPQSSVRNVLTGLDGGTT